MKLNVNPKELLALYNLLHARVEQSREVSDVGDDVHLRQVYNRLRAIIVAGLTNKVVDPVDSWLKHEKEKVERLNDQVDAVKAKARDLGQRLPPATSDILTDDDNEVPGDLAYPSRRKGPPPPHVPRPGRHGRRK